MAYTVKKGNKVIRFGRTRNAFHTKREAIIIRKYGQVMHPRSKFRIVKVR